MPAPLLSSELGRPVAAYPQQCLHLSTSRLRWRRSSEHDTRCGTKTLSLPPMMRLRGHGPPESRSGKKSLHRLRSPSPGPKSSPPTRPLLPELGPLRRRSRRWVWREAPPALSSELAQRRARGRQLRAPRPRRGRSPCFRLPGPRRQRCPRMPGAQPQREEPRGMPRPRAAGIWDRPRCGSQEPTALSTRPGPRRLSPASWLRLTKTRARLSPLRRRTRAAGSSRIPSGPARIPTTGLCGQCLATSSARVFQTAVATQPGLQALAAC